jgi:hypothetical protein
LTFLGDLIMNYYAKGFHRWKCKIPTKYTIFLKSL